MLGESLDAEGDGLFAALLFAPAESHGGFSAPSCVGCGDAFLLHEGQAIRRSQYVASWYFV